ncbi:MAG: hypothetical protein Q7S92_06375, partial [Candidatus Diapherotrites archaeon]|nr:hypothetical protein [Candidatus Diapherotrites archaeon]
VMSQELGGKILEQFPELTVNLKNAEQFVFVEIRDNWACVFVNELHALNGLPVGTAGVLALLWNNSQESILSCLLLLRRGCKVVIIFSKKPDEKKLILLKELSAWNSFRDLDWILFENLNTEKEKRKILALANPSIEVSLTSFGQDLDLFKQYNLVVLRPLNLFSKQMVKEKLTELMYLDF